MSHIEAFTFIQNIKRDPVLASRIRAAPDVHTKLALAAAAGYPCTVADLESLAGMLDEADLDGIAGGIFLGCLCHGSSGKAGN